MGFFDVLNGMRNGPSGETDPNASGGGMSPIAMAILGLLAYKTVKKIGEEYTTPGASSAAGGATATNAPAQSGGGLFGGLTSSIGGMLGGGSGTAGNLGGGLGGSLGGLGGLLGGAATGGALSGGLGDLMKQFQNAGHGETVNSWVAPGANKPIAPADLESVLGNEQIQDLIAKTGLSKDQLLDGLSRFLPDAVHHLTPDGRVPTEQEVSQRL